MAIETISPDLLKKMAEERTPEKKEEILRKYEKLCHLSEKESRNLRRNLKDVR